MININDIYIEHYEPIYYRKSFYINNDKKMRYFIEYTSKDRQPGDIKFYKISKYSRIVYNSGSYRLINAGLRLRESFVVDSDKKEYIKKYTGKR